MIRLVGKGFGINVAHLRYTTRQWRRYRIISIHNGITIGVLHRFHSHFGICISQRSQIMHCTKYVVVCCFSPSLSHFIFLLFFYCSGVFFCPFNIYLCGIYFNLFAFAFALNMYLLPRCVCVFFYFFVCVIFVIIINYYWPLLRCVCISLISCKLCVISFSVSAAAAPL